MAIELYEIQQSESRSLGYKPLIGDAWRLAYDSLKNYGVGCHAKTLGIDGAIGVGKERTSDLPTQIIPTTDGESNTDIIVRTKGNVIRPSAKALFKVSADMTTGQVVFNQVAATKMDDKIYFTPVPLKKKWPFQKPEQAVKIFVMNPKEFLYLFHPEGDGLTTAVVPLHRPSALLDEAQRSGDPVAQARLIGEFDQSFKKNPDLCATQKNANTLYFIFRQATGNPQLEQLATTVYRKLYLHNPEIIVTEQAKEQPALPGTRRALESAEGHHHT